MKGKHLWGCYVALTVSILEPNWNHQLTIVEPRDSSFETAVT